MFLLPGSLDPKGGVPILGQHANFFRQTVFLQLSLALSSGEFVGVVADNPDQKITLKSFCAEILNDHQALKREQNASEPIPAFVDINPLEISRIYLRVKAEVVDLVQAELERLMGTPELTHCIVPENIAFTITSFAVDVREINFFN